MNFVAFGCSEVIMQKNTAFRENHTVLRPKMIERWICKTTSGQVVGKFNFLKRTSPQLSAKSHIQFCPKLGQG